MPDNQSHFTWRPLYAKLVKKLPEFSSKELIELTNQIGISKGFRDQNPENTWIEMEDIDPFTFLSMLNKYGDEKRINYLNKLLSLLNPGVPPATDVDGLPTANAQRVWWFGYKYKRKADDIPNLKLLFQQVINDSIEEEQFSRALNTYGVAHAKLTEGLFYVNPEKYLPINGQTIPYLEKKGISTKFNTFQEYCQILKDCKEKLPQPFYVVSYDAFVENSTEDFQEPDGTQNGVTKFWKYSPGQSSSYSLEQVRQNNAIGLHYKNLPNLTPFKTLEELEKATGYENQGLTYLRYALYFRNAQINDVVFLNDKRSRVIGIGIINGPYQYDESAPFEHSRSVQWLTDKIWNYKKHSIKNYATLFASDPFCYTGIGDQILEEYIKTYPEYKALFEKAGKLRPETEKEPASAQKTIFPKNTILYGPPGTGKTYTTIDKAVQLIDGQKSPDHRINKKRFDALLGSQIEFITFHQNYTYEDFVLGIKPDLEDSGTSLRFSRHEGVFYRLAKRSQEKYEAYLTGKEPLKNYVLIIDEINRANMSRVFGELITLLEEDKRLGAENELKIALPSGEQFAVPPNLYIIGTMNTADKSLALLDIALRRRFEFEGMYPQYELPGMDKETGDILKNLNNAIHEQKKSADFLIGHAYFLNKKRGELSGVFEKRVIPLLMEYFSGRTEMAREVLQKAGIKTKLCDFSYQLLVDDDTL